MSPFSPSGQRTQTDDASSRLLQEMALLVTGALDNYLGFSASMSRLHEAMRYGVMNGGKRIRPVLLLQTLSLLGHEYEKGLAAACALEMVHCYSLIHDDLPAMDDDDLRRGQPTVHKAYDEATAILAGNGLLTKAFEILVQAYGDQPALAMVLTKLLAGAAGGEGLLQGQMLDLAAEGRFCGKQSRQELNEQDIRHLQALKTGRLLEVAVEMACCLAGADHSAQESLLTYARALGRAFQMSDDLLDVRSSAGQAGKATGKDAARGKVTFVSLWGEKGACDALEDTVRTAREALSGFGEKAGWHDWLVTSLLDRTQ
jgi:farnesyl diphosphate synthase